MPINSLPAHPVLANGCASSNSLDALLMLNSYKDLQVLLEEFGPSGRRLLQNVLKGGFTNSEPAGVLTPSYQAAMKSLARARRNSLHGKSPAETMQLLGRLEWRRPRSWGRDVAEYSRVLDWGLRTGRGPIRTELEPVRIVAGVPADWWDTVAEAVPTLGLVAALELPNLITPATMPGQ